APPVRTPTRKSAEHHALALVRPAHALHRIRDVTPLLGFFRLAATLAGLGQLGRLRNRCATVPLQHLPRDGVDLNLGHHERSPRVGVEPRRSIDPPRLQANGWAVVPFPTRYPALRRRSMSLGTSISTSSVETSSPRSRRTTTLVGSSVTCFETTARISSRSTPSRSGCPRNPRSWASRICRRSRATGAEPLLPRSNLSRPMLMQPSVAADD